MRPLLVFETLHPDRAHTLFSVWGIRWAATPYAWLSPLFWVALGSSVLLAEKGVTGVAASPAQAVGYAVLLYCCNLTHSLGHCAAGLAVGWPMQTNLLTATRDVSIYPPSPQAPRVVRLKRALGGPGANLAVGVIALVAFGALGWHWLRLLSLFNFGVGAGTLIPLPTLDGFRLYDYLAHRRDKEEG